MGFFDFLKSKPSPQEKDTAKDNSNSDLFLGNNFLKALSIYYRDFLDTDFKRQRLPKRSVTNKDRAGNLTGVPIRKYPSLHEEIWGKLNQSINEGIELKIVRGRHRSKLDKNILDVINKQTAAIDPEVILNINVSIVQKSKDLSTTYKDDPDSYKAKVVEYLEGTVLAEIVRPLLGLLETYFEKVANKPIETIYEVEDELTSRIIAETEDVIGMPLNTGLVSGSFEELEKLLPELFEIDLIKTKIENFFSGFATGDLYVDLHNLINTTRLKDNCEIYLYIGELDFKKHIYPPFYLPLSIEKEKNTFKVFSNSHIYINKKAIEYIGQEIARANSKNTSAFIKDRILYLEANESCAERIQCLIDEWALLFSLKDPIDFKETREQTSRSLDLRMTNKLHLAAFDKSDESMLNDYESLLDMADVGGEEFKELELIADIFIKDDPPSVTPEVDKEWRELSTSDHLVTKSPIPLNEQQRKIASALEKPTCRFVSVQGPPGTGKSHTITALAFNNILKGRNVLILSDKKEALDVVEDKLSQTLSTVRLSKDFQNPILRLGRASSSYEKILRGQSIDKIKTHNEVARFNQKEFEREVNLGEKKIKESLENTINVYSNISISDIISFEKFEKSLAKEIPKPHSLIEDDDSAETIFNLEVLKNFLSNNQGDLIKVLRSCKRSNINDIEGLLKVLAIKRSFLKINCKQAALGFFSTFSSSDVELLKNYITKYQDAALNVFGFIFSKKKAREIDGELGNALNCVNSLNAHTKLNLLISAHQSLAELKQIIEKRNCDAQYYDIAFQLLTYDIKITDEEIRACRNAVINLKGKSIWLQRLMRVFEIEKDLLSLFENESSCSETLTHLFEYRKQHNKIKEEFATIPKLDYLTEKGKLESLYTQQLANMIDERVVDFYENKKATAKTLKEIIRKKQKFPKDKFEDMKKAFPCIIANIRDYAEYVPLKKELFDLVIIDEASQVSIAQAFPAILRAKKMVVLGDPNQFSNVKTNNASIDVNNNYLNAVKKAFIEEYGRQSDQLQRLSKFNIKTSILEFMEMLANFSIMLKIHFRGYPELISFSSKYFYDDSLQAVKIRGKSIDEVLKFNTIEHDGKKELKGNINELEANEILNILNELIELQEPPSVGIITPFTDQQTFISSYIQKESQNSEKLISKLRLKIMTFDSCQGEERDIILYSLVANPAENKLHTIFPKNLDRTEEVETKLRLQRLNVGFSRAKECIYFITSLPIKDLGGTIGIATKHFANTLEEERKEPTANDVDPKSPMERKLLNWLKQTNFYRSNKSNVEIIPQFPIGKYLRQMDPTYDHPQYRVDFLLRINIEDCVHTLIIEYDGFTEHFINLDEVNSSNYQSYYKSSDIEREKILESYGYRMLRVNRFNLGKDPVSTLSSRLDKLVKLLTTKINQHEKVKKKFY